MCYSSDDSAIYYVLSVWSLADDITFSHNGANRDTDHWRIIHRDSPGGAEGKVLPAIVLCCKLQQSNRKCQTSSPILYLMRHFEYTPCRRRLCLAAGRIMTSSKKPAVCNILHCRQRRTELRPYLTRIENFARFGHVFLRYANGHPHR